MKKLFIIGLGPGSIDDLTLGAIKRIKDSSFKILRTKEHPTVEYFDQENISYESYDYLYEKSTSFDQVYSLIVDDLIEKIDQYKTVSYFVPGNPMVAERTVKKLLGLKDVDFQIELISGLSFIEPVLEGVEKDPIDGLAILDGSNLKFSDININLDCILTQVYNKRIASDIKLLLSEVYGDEYKVYLINAGGIDEIEEILYIPLYELDRVDGIGHLTSLYIPKINKTIDDIYSISDIIHTMMVLRGPEGCSWDRQQTYDSLREYIVEEAYELIEAIEKDDLENMVEELGDLLLQVIFLSQIGFEEGDFNFYDVTTELNKKLKYRHPHVFSNKKVENTEEIIYNWNGLKYKDKEINTLTDKLTHVSNFSSLMKSFKIQQIMSDKGFDWVDIQGPFDKIREESEEIRELISGNEKNKSRYEEEVGDLFFSVVNLSRFLEVNPEIALKTSIDKFIKRVGAMEDLSKRRKLKLDTLSLEEWDLLWKESKKNEN